MIYATVSSKNLRTNSFGTAGILTSNNVFSSGQKMVLTYRRAADGTCSVYLNKTLLVSQVVTGSLNTDTVAYRFSGNPLNPAQRLFVGNLYNAIIVHEELQGEKLIQLIRNSAFNAGIKI